jgi:3-dehydroquinate synthetase/shikimate kinase
VNARNALDRHVALIGFMGAGKSTVGPEVAKRFDRTFVDIDRELEAQFEMSIGQAFVEKGEPFFRAKEAETTVAALRSAPPAVLGLGGGSLASEQVREALRARAVTVLLDVDVDEAWRRVRGGDRPLAQDQLHFSALLSEREPLYRAAADATARSVDDVVLGAGGIHLGVGLIERLGELVPGEGPVALVSDMRVAGIHGPAAQLALGERLVSTHVLPPGEEAKTTVACEGLWRELTLDRSGTIVALGGGCTTDAAGFVAATYLRGIDWVAVPTTLVSQVDAAIGGKTAINLAEGKNLVGAFHWPVATVIDPALLDTLPERERSEGLAEVVKAGLLAGERLWELPEPEAVERCAVFKAALCLRDPYDRGPRQALNLGHTFAHALESAADHELSHGSAVALGLLAALRLSGLPTHDVEKALRPKRVRVDFERAWGALGRDKKRREGRIRLVLLEAPGQPLIGQERPEEAVREALRALIA